MNLSEEEKKRLINNLAKELPVLRAMIGASQEEVADMLCLTRQTYCSLESGKRPMTWNVYLALVFIYEKHGETRQYLGKSDAYPHMFGETEETPVSEGKLSDILLAGDILNRLDDQAVHTIETVAMVEYARCSNIKGNAVVKAFNGKSFTKVIDSGGAARGVFERLENNK